MSDPSTNNPNAVPPELLETLRGLISQTRQQLLRSVDVAQVQTDYQLNAGQTRARLPYFSIMS